ncbi:hypothetical protein M404DRAFT_153867 [Pisolithus tinctorius Marx 270]|uniref:Uncharacterized protein n=1 Tax=Pisolithus tinctorius Marx 270 TaxID=870435 RepID=A0A0C3NXN5_PISTI|nr:hypothetical protein M404DRAFT_153867 [Pisolithus tinctorius Marx 270]
MILPAAEKWPQDLLRDKYVYKHWQEAFNTVMGAEGDTTQAVAGVEKLTQAALHHTRLTIKIPTHTDLPLLVALEEALSNSIKILKLCNQIIGLPPTIDKVLDPKDEQEIGESQYAFKGRDAEIVVAVQCELAIEQGEVVELDSDDEDQQTPLKLDYADLINMWETIKSVCMQVSDANSSLDLERLCHQFHGMLHCEELRNTHTQTKLEQYFIRK